jgi:hypothetical protein
MSKSQIRLRGIINVAKPQPMLEPHLVDKNYLEGGVRVSIMFKSHFR